MHWATYVMNGWATLEDCPAEYREAVRELASIDLTGAVPPMVNYVFSYAEDGS